MCCTGDGKPTVSLCHYAAIEGLLVTAKGIPPEHLPVHFDLISKECHTLQRLVSDATLYLTSFELKSAQEVCCVCMCANVHANILLEIWTFEKFWLPSNSQQMYVHVVCGCVRACMCVCMCVYVCVCV